MSPQRSKSHSSWRSRSTSPLPSSSTADENGRFASRMSKASDSERDAAAEAWQRYFDNKRGNWQTAYLKALAKVEGRRHRGETVEASHQERLDRLENILKEAEAACSKAESGLDQCIELANSQSVTSMPSRYQSISLRGTSDLPNIPPMLTIADWKLGMAVFRSQNQCQEECKTAIQKLRSEYPDGPYTLEMCSGVIRAGEKYIKLNTAAALIERQYSAKGIEDYQEEQEREEAAAGVTEGTQSVERWQQQYEWVLENFGQTQSVAV